jgi:hypothetical protein
LSNYTKTTNFTAKDSLPSGNANKKINGSLFDTEFDALATAVNSKADSAAPTFTGLLTAASGTFSSTLGVTGLLTATAGITSGSNIVSDTDSTDDLGSTGVRWANLWVDDITVTTSVTAGGDITGLTLKATGDTSVGDAAAMGYTATEGAIITGQGSTYDVTLKNDADAVVMGVPTGTQDVSYFGNVGIGTSSPFGTAHVKTGASGAASANVFGDSLVVESNTSDGISILNPSNAIGSLMFGDETDNFVGGLRYDHSVDDLAIHAGNAERMTINSSGNVGIGTSSPSQALDVVGAIEVSGGIYLGGTAAANLLDDYEEGTWTVVIADAATAGNVGSASENGEYVKVGALVSVTMLVNNIDTTGLTAGNTLYFRGFPFTADAGVTHVGSVIAGQLTFSGSLGFNLVANTTYGYIVESASASNVSSIKVSEINSGVTDIISQTTYKIN